MYSDRLRAVQVQVFYSDCLMFLELDCSPHIGNSTNWMDDLERHTSMCIWFHKGIFCRPLQSDYVKTLIWARVQNNF